MSVIKGYVRDINLDILTGDYKFDVDVSRRYFIKWLMPNGKLVKYITKMGGVLTGSRALRCYSLKGVSMLDRDSTDWDFIVTPNIAFKVCAKFGIQEIPEVGDVISVENQLFWRHPAYSDAYRVGPVDVQMIIKEDLSEYIEHKGVRIAPFTNIINEKIKLMNSSPGTEEAIKHQEDLIEMIIKFKSIY